jgi:hypothetical protein
MSFVPVLWPARHVNCRDDAGPERGSTLSGWSMRRREGALIMQTDTSISCLNMQLDLDR